MSEQLVMLRFKDRFGNEWIAGAILGDLAREGHLEPIIELETIVGPLSITSFEVIVPNKEEGEE